MSNRIYSDIYQHISSFLGDINTVKSLDVMCTTSSDLYANRCSAKQLITSYPKEDRFIEACKMGYMDGVVYYFDADKKQEAFLQCCIHRHLELAKWFLGLGGIDVHAENNLVFRRSCTKVRKQLVGESDEAYSEYVLTILEWLYSLGGIDLAALNKERERSLFAMCCWKGKLIVAKWLHGFGGMDHIHAKNEEIFRFTCKHGHLAVAQWLYSLGGIDIHAITDHAFVLSCSGGHLAVAQWLYGLGGVNVHAHSDLAFKNASWNGFLPVIQWLYTFGGIADRVLQLSFKYACINGHLDVAQWLYGLGGIDLHTEGNQIFIQVCANGHLELAQWLYSLDGIDAHVENDLAFRSSEKYPHVKEWLSALP